MEMGLEIRLCDVQARNAERDNHDKTGKDETEPLYRAHFNGPGEARAT